MTAWLVMHPDDWEGRRNVMVAMPNAHGQPSVLVDERGQVVMLNRPRGLSDGDWVAQLNKQLLPRFNRVDEVFQQMLRRYG